MIRYKNRQNKLWLSFLIFSLMLVTGIVTVSAQGDSYSIVQWFIGSGGEQVSGGDYSLNTSIGEPIAGSSSGGEYSVESGQSSSLAIPFTPTPYPEMDIVGNGQSISDGDSTPSKDDQTDFGVGFLGYNLVTRTFTIKNTGAQELLLTSGPNYAEIIGTHAADFTVTTQPSSPVATFVGTTTFTISFNPSAIGLRQATVSIANNDPDEDPYTFAIQGTGSDGTFSDVTSAHWAFPYVEAIARAGLTSGYPDGTYRPENPVTRAEMAVFLLNGMGITPPLMDGSHPFRDITGHWAEGYIEELFDQGITGGYPDGTYRPENWSPGLRWRSFC